MNIPKVKLDIGNNGVVHIELYNYVSEYLMAYIKSSFSKYVGYRCDHRLKDIAEQDINSKLKHLVYTGQLFQELDGTWEVDGFLWTDNEY